MVQGVYIYATRSTAEWHRTAPTSRKFWFSDFGLAISVLCQAWRFSMPKCELQPQARMSILVLFRRFVLSLPPNLANVQVLNCKHLRVCSKRVPTPVLSSRALALNRVVSPDDRHNRKAEAIMQVLYDLYAETGVHTFHWWVQWVRSGVRGCWCQCECALSSDCQCACK